MRLLSYAAAYIIPEGYIIAEGYIICLRMKANLIKRGCLKMYIAV
jgi:hypothetical protein